MNNIPQLIDIEKAAGRIRGLAHHTPVLTCSTIDQLLDAKLYFKCENLQKVGAFKFRGAANAVLSLSEEEAACGVATHSSGNHAQALALAAKLRGIPAFIVMPENSPQVKKAAVAGYGAQITFCKPTLAARESTLETVIGETGAAFVHPYNDYRVIAGQATAAYELIGDVQDLDFVITPVGGGGLLSGTALSVSYLSPQTRTIAGEPAGADDAFRSLKAGKIMPSQSPQTIADGLLTSLGDKTYPIISRHVERIITVEDHQIVQAMRLIWERMKIIVEPSSAVPLAALMARRNLFKSKKIGVIISGGNVDLGKIPEYWHIGTMQ